MSDSVLEISCSTSRKFGDDGRMIRMHRVGWTLAVVGSLLSTGCGARAELLVRGFAPVPGDPDGGGSRRDGGGTIGPDGSIIGPDGGPVIEPTDRLDMLVVVDNSGSMAQVQTQLMVKFEVMLENLRVPLCGSRSNPNAEPHACVGNDDEVQLTRPLRDMHVGVVSTDLGTPGSMVPGCDDSDRGDDGLLNPIRHGASLQAHLPWAPRRPSAQRAPAGFRPPVCADDTMQFPAFITYCSNTADASCDIAAPFSSTRDSSTFSSWFRCNSGLFVNGCGLESPLEAAWRALVEHDARSAPGNTSINAGFLRDDAALAIVVFTDEEDGSVRNCEHDGGFSATRGESCNDALGVYNPASPEWAHPTNPDLRLYLYPSGSRHDPTWNLDRYANTTPTSNPSRWNRDFWSLKPGRPDRVIFAAVTGVPLEIPRVNGAVNYDALLGAPRAGNVDDFIGRDSTTAVAGMQGMAGPFSMRHANLDPSCVHVVPACRREGSTFNPATPCIASQSMAFPSRRVVEVARRFEESPRCNGAPCNNGYVSSICAATFEVSLREIAVKIARRLR